MSTDANHKEFLAKNTGIVTGIAGPGGTPAQFGEITSWTITKEGKNTEAAQKFVSYMMNEGYADWLGIAPEGKFPVRKGTQDDAAKFTTAWNKLPAGVDTKKPLGEVYPAEVIEALQKSPDTFQRWGFPQKQGALVGATLGELPVGSRVRVVFGKPVQLAAVATDPENARDRRAATDAIMTAIGDLSGQDYVNRYAR